MTYMATTVSKDVVGELQLAGIHLVQAGDVVEAFLGDALARLLEHLRRQIDADDLEVALVVGQRQPGADADLEHAAWRVLMISTACLRPSVATLPKVWS